ncbi:MAG: hypothetical protein ACTSWN_14420 [Promethearchaeota archaeon]
MSKKKNEQKVKEKKKIKDSNELLNIFMIIVGGIFVFQGIMYYLEIYGIDISFLPSVIRNTLYGTGAGTQAFKSLLGDQANLQLVLGAFCLIAGIGLFQEQEWAWGMSIIILSIMITTTAGSVISTIASGGFDYKSWALWIKIISVTISGIGILWLLFTKSRYS